METKTKELIVLKVGSSTLTAGTQRISRGKIEDIARQLLVLQQDYEIVLVSSGAIATAKQFINIKGWENVVSSKQAMSAIGQPKLMQIYYEIFSDFGLKIAQCLLTYRDFESENSKTNTFNTIAELLKHGYLPIINENDTVSVEEIIVGDNDQLSAKVATLIKAKKLVLASDIDGLYDQNPHLYPEAQFIENVTDFSVLNTYIEEKSNGLGTGGMTSKIKAAKICTKAGIEVFIVNGNRRNFLVDCLKKQIPFTKFSKS
ncbi:MAG: glutamate 5-kinase [Chitinophagales bacterium]